MIQPKDLERVIKQINKMAKTQRQQHESLQERISDDQQAIRDWEEQIVANDKQNEQLREMIKNKLGSIEKHAADLASVNQEITEAQAQAQRLEEMLRNHVQ
jgi:chromosome segregation ATPase